MLQHPKIYEIILPNFSEKTQEILRKLFLLTRDKRRCGQKFTFCPSAFARSRYILSRTRSKQGIDTDKITSNLNIFRQHLIKIAELME